MAELEEKLGGERVLTCHKANIFELILTILEDELIAGRENNFSSHTGLQ